MTVKIGYIGTGNMGVSHIKVFAEHCGKQAQGVAVFDTHEASIKKALEVIPNATVHTSLDSLLASNIDAVVISTPNFIHLQQVEAAFKAGKHVFAEKPVATTAKDCHRMVEIGKINPDQIFFIGHEYRYSTYFAKINELITSGVIGTLQYLWCKEFRGPFMEKVDQWIIDERRSGGTLVDKNGHHFDLMNWWAKGTPKQVSAFGSRKFNIVTGDEYEVIDNAVVNIQYDNGIIGTLMLCMFAPNRCEDCLELGAIGDKGLLETRFGENAILVWPNKGAKEVDEPVRYEVKEETVGFGNHNGFVEEHHAFLQAIATGRKPLSDVSHCVDATLLAIAAEKAIKENRIIQVR